ncbi:MAG: hypothetical protein EAZ97_09685 [Bacteroidetes bacterium]|nr:MAG: hypothetical protein EAZ97_09685 [Bacteroidota bacterium]
MFMQTRALFLVLWDWETEQTEKQQITENNKINEYQNHGLDYWLNYVSVLGKGSKAIVVQTKAIKHGIKNHLNENNLRQKYADIWLDSVAIDSQENNWAKNGFKKLKLAIENALESGEALRQEQLPKNWIAQREDIYKLIENKEKIIGYDYFVTEMCQNKTISPDTILSWLSDSGVVFYREGLFENKIIIDQQWAIDAVYTLFDRKKYYYRLKEAKGKFTKEDLKEFWENYKTPEQELFLSFMISCEICYKFENQYIAPALLPAEKEGESLTDFWQGKVFDTEKYEFTFLHYGIIQGFIVRLNNFRSENIAVQSVWQYGIFFKYNNLYASVKANLQDKTILVSVSHSEDQSLLNKIQNLIYELDSKENIKIIYSQDRKINENDKFENDKKQISLEDLTNDIEKALRNMMDLKHNPNEKENPYNDVLASHLKMIYEIADQSRGGISHKGNDLGEKDIVINSSSGEFSIIEALRLSSIKEIIDTHIFKLINNYDTQGHKRNYIVVYAQAKNFLNLWNKYKIYVNDLNNKPFFQKSKYPQIGNFEEKESDITDLKKGISKYRREGSEVEIYHFFVNMFLDKK